MSHSSLAVLFIFVMTGGEPVAKGKYEKWLEPDGLLLLEAWARDGLTDEQIAKNMGINVATLYRYKQTYCEICEALKRGKDVVDVEVENALYKRALGCTVTEEIQELRENPDTGKCELVTTKKIIKEIPPDTTAQIFFLKNRRPDLWRDKQSLEMSGEVKNNPFAGLTTEQLIILADAGDDA